MKRITKVILVVLSELYIHAKQLVKEKKETCIALLQNNALGSNTILLKLLTPNPTRFS